MTEDAIFAYVDNIPTKGCWIDVTPDTTHDDILAALAAAGHRRVDEVMVACADGLAATFLSEFGSFDLAGYIDCASAEGDPQAKRAFVDHYGNWDADAFEDALVGHAESMVAFTENWFDELYGEVIQQAEAAGLHIDWDATARDLFINDLWYDAESGAVFRHI